MTESPDLDTVYIDTSTATEKYAQIEAQYPAYYKAWRSMISNNSIDVIAISWRGVFGLMKFIEDTSILPSNPDSCPTVKSYIKRKQPSLPYSAANVYWYTPVKYKNNLPLDRSAKMQYPGLRTVEDITSLSAEELEERITELFNKQFTGGTLTQHEQVELDILAAYQAGKEIPIAVSIPKCEDI